MAVGSRLKASEKQDICKKLMTLLKKRYRPTVPDAERPVLETMLYAVCLENASHYDADRVLQRLYDVFHDDLNEMRVSSMTEIEEAIGDVSEAPWRALRVRYLLHHVFESVFEYRYEEIRKKTQEQAVKDLERFPHMTPFIRLYTMQTALGGHVIPLDRLSLAVLLWLGLIDPGQSAEEASASLKPAIRKADVPLFCYLVRSVATDPEFRTHFENILPTKGERFEAVPPEDGFDPATGLARMKKLLAGELPVEPTTEKPESKSASKKSGGTKKTAKKATEGDSEPETGSKQKKAAGKKTAASKASAKKTADKKTPAKKSTAKKSSTKKTGSGKKTAGKSTGRKSSSRS